MLWTGIRKSYARITFRCQEATAHSLLHQCSQLKACFCPTQVSTTALFHSRSLTRNIATIVVVICGVQHRTPYRLVCHAVVAGARRGIFLLLALVTIAHLFISHWPNAGSTNESLVLSWKAPKRFWLTNSPRYRCFSVNLISTISFKFPWSLPPCFGVSANLFPKTKLELSWPKLFNRTVNITKSFNCLRLQNPYAFVHEARIGCALTTFFSNIYVIGSTMRSQ